MTRPACGEAHVSVLFGPPVRAGVGTRIERRGPVVGFELGVSSGAKMSADVADAICLYQSLGNMIRVAGYCAECGGNKLPCKCGGDT